MTATPPSVPDELFEAAVRAFYARRFPNGDRGDYMLRLDSEMYAEDFRTALAVAFAAGQRAAHEGGKTEWGVRRVGFRSVRITSEQRGRSLLRNWAVPGELVTRRIGPWVRVPVDAAGTEVRDA